MEKLLGHLKDELELATGTGPNRTEACTPEPDAIKEEKVAGKRGFSEESLEAAEDLIVDVKRFCTDGVY